MVRAYFMKYSSFQIILSQKHSFTSNHGLCSRTSSNQRVSASDKHFTGTNGIVMTLEHFDDKYEVMKFDCTPFSAFPDERETLFFGPNTVLQITELRQRTISGMKVYDKWLEPIDKVYDDVNWELYDAMISVECNLLRIADLLEHHSASVSVPQYVRDLIKFQNQPIYHKLKGIYGGLQDMLCERFPSDVVMPDHSE